MLDFLTFTVKNNYLFMAKSLILYISFTSKISLYFLSKKFKKLKKTDNQTYKIVCSFSRKTVVFTFINIFFLLFFYISTSQIQMQIYFLINQYFYLNRKKNRIKKKIFFFSFFFLHLQITLNAQIFSFFFFRFIFSNKRKKILFPFFLYFKSYNITFSFVNSYLLSFFCHLRILI